MTRPIRSFWALALVSNPSFGVIEGLVPAADAEDRHTVARSIFCNAIAQEELQQSVDSVTQP